MAGPYGTRSQNANAHPGKPDLPPPRRSGQEVADDKVKVQNEKAAAKKKTENSIKAAAKMEDQMAKEDEEVRATRVTRSMRPKSEVPKPTKARVKPAPLQREGAIADIEADDVSQASAGDKADGSKRKRAAAASVASKKNIEDFPELDGELTELEATPVPAKKRQKKDPEAMPLRSAIQTARTSGGTAGPASTSDSASKVLKSAGAELRGRQPRKRRAWSPHTRGPPASSRVPLIPDMQVDQGNLNADILQNWLPDSESNISAAQTGKPAKAPKTASAMRTKATPPTPYSQPPTPTDSGRHPPPESSTTQTDSEQQVRSKSQSKTKSKTTAKSTTSTKTTVSESKTHESKSRSKSKSKADSKVSGGAKSSSKIDADSAQTMAAPSAHAHTRDAKADTVQSKPSKSTKPRPRPVSKPKESEPNKVVDVAIFGSDDESAEREAALSSPIKGVVARRTSQNMVAVKDVDVDAQKPKRIKKEPGLPPVNDTDATPAEKASSKKNKKNKKGKGKGKKVSSEEENAPTADHDSDIEIVDDAAASAPKSQRSVSSSSSGTSKPASKTKWTTSDLPAGAQEDERWSSVFIPTLLKYQATRHDVWTWEPATSVAIVQKIWDEVYGDSLPHKVVLNDNVHKVATQKMYDWRSAMAAAAVALFESCFNSSAATRFVEYIPDEDEDEEEALEGINEALLPVYAARAKFCKRIHQGFQFVYRDPLGHDKPNAHAGLFHSPFILPILASHLEQTANALYIPELYQPDDPKRPTSPDRPIGAIALIASAVERVVMLWMHGRMQLAPDGKPFCPKKLNPQTGKMSTSGTDFRSSNFLAKTADYKSSAVSLKPGQMAALLASASGHNHGGTRGGGGGQTPVKQTALRHQLVEEEDDDDFRQDRHVSAHGSTRIKKEPDAMEVEDIIAPSSDAGALDGPLDGGEILHCDTEDVDNMDLDPNDGDDPARHGSGSTRSRRRDEDDANDGDDHGAVLDSERQDGLHDGDDGNVSDDDENGSSSSSDNDSDDSGDDDDDDDDDDGGDGDDGEHDHSSARLRAIAKPKWTGSGSSSEDDGEAAATNDEL